MTDDDGVPPWWRRRNRLTPRQRAWLGRLAQVEPGLKLGELAAMLGEPYATVQRWAAFLGYPIRDGRSERSSRVNWSSVDWRKPNVAIARELGVSRERVRQVRREMIAKQDASRPSAPKRRAAQSPNSSFDWRLPNRDLAEIHGMTVQQVANLRFRMNAGPARWDVRGGRHLKDPQYVAARSQEAKRGGKSGKNR